MSQTETETAAGGQDEGGARQEAVIEVAFDPHGDLVLEPAVVHLHDVGRVTWRSADAENGGVGAFRVVFQSGPAQPFAEAAGAHLPLSSAGDGTAAAWRLVLRSDARDEVAATIASGLPAGIHVFTVIAGADADFPEGQAQGALDNTPLAGTPVIVVSSDPPL